MSVDRIVVYADFNCPWSYLASRRAAVLATDGVQVDWRAVEHEPRCPGRLLGRSARLARLRGEMDQVVAELLPGEVLPYSLAGFVPYTGAAVSGYAEAYAAGVATEVRQLLFEAFWMHAFDLGDATVVRTLLVDAVRSGSSPSDLLHEWGYAVDVTGGPVTTAAWRLLRVWAELWPDKDTEPVPVLVVDDAPPRFGIHAVTWLGAEMLTRGLESRPVPTSVHRAVRPSGDLASLSWVSQHGNRWMRAYQRARGAPPFPTAG